MLGFLATLEVFNSSIAMINRVNVFTAIQYLPCLFQFQRVLGVLLGLLLFLCYKLTRNP